MGPSEEEPHSIEDCGLSPADLELMSSEWRLTMIAAHQRVMASKAFDWQMLNCVIESSEKNGPCGGAVTTAVRPRHAPRPFCISVIL